MADKIERDFHYPNESGSGYLEGELQAFRFIVGETERLARMGNVPERVLEKYTNTLSFLRTALGDDLFTLAGKLTSKLPDAVAATPERK